jgi:5-methylcytosine-specific restriction endonuclease McrA
VSPSARYHAKRRLLALRKVHGSDTSPHCVRCGATAHLEIDHIDNDGHLDRKRYGHAGFITAVLRDLPHGRLQILCTTCHAAKTAAALRVAA